MSKLSSRENVDCIKTQYLHGFMNKRSVNFDQKGYVSHLTILSKNISHLVSTKSMLYLLVSDSVHNKNHLLYELMDMNKLSLDLKLKLIFGSLIIMFAVFGIYTIISANKFSSITSTIYKHPLQVSNASLEVLNRIIRMQKSMKEIHIINNEQQFFITLESINQNEKLAYEQFELILSTIQGGEEGKGLTNHALQQFRSWKPLRDEVIRLVQEGKKKEAMSISKQKYGVFMKDLESKVEELNRYARNRADSLMSEVIKGGEELSFIYTVLFGLFALFACVSISIVFARNLLSQLGADPNELSEVAERISDGDIDIDFKSENRTGVYKVMKEMVDALKEAREADETRRWHRSGGVVGLDDSIRGGEDNVENMADIIISHLAEYTNSLTGSLYLSGGYGNLEFFSRLCCL